MFLIGLMCFLSIFYSKKAKIFVLFFLEFTFKFYKTNLFINVYICTNLQIIGMMINNEEHNDEIGNNHIATNTHNPVREDAFDISDEEKITRIKKDVESILLTLGMDLTDDSLKGTPNRVAKMFVKEIFGGLNPNKKPSASTFDNKYKYGEMLVEKNIVVYSTCEHHLLPIYGRAHIAYISNGTVVGLSKMNRIVEFYAKRPQVQERLTIQIVKELQEVLNTEDVACVIDAKHMCVNSRGIKDIESSTVTSEFGGKFKEEKVKREFLDYIKLDTRF
jgi:GTP cyclohydrolase I